MIRNNIRMLARVLLAVGLLLFLAACGGESTAGGSIQINDPWVRAIVVSAEDEMAMEEMDHSEMDHSEMDHGSGVNSAAYMLLVNSGDAPDRLISATTDVAEVVELHTVLEEDGVMRMRPVEQIDIPAGGQTELRPGGFHVMLIGVQEDLTAGETVDITLTFENAGEQVITASIRDSVDANMSMEDGEMEMEDDQSEELD